MAAAVLAGLAFVAMQYASRGALPHPFNADPSEARMDFYNTAFWAHVPGAYNIWHSVYPPLSFVFVRLFTNASCYALTPYAARACDPAAAWAIVAFYLANGGLAFLAFWRSSAATAVPRTLALCLGLPMLYSLDLANLIIPCFTAFVLAEGGLLRARWARRLCLALSLNFKPYLLVMAIPRLLRLRIGWLVGVGVAGVIVYLVTLALFGAGSPRALLEDVYVYASSQTQAYADVNHLTAIAARSANLWQLTMPAVLRLGQGVSIGGFLVAALSRRPVNGRWLAALALTWVCGEGALHTQGFSADYTQIFLIFIVFLDAEATSASLFIRVLAYLLCFSPDITLLHVDTVSRVGFYSGRTSLVDFDLSFSQFVRPMLVVFMQIGLTGLVWRDAIRPKLASHHEGEQRRCRPYVRRHLTDVT